MSETAILTGNSQVMGGITVLDSPLVTDALDLARIRSEAFLFNHVVRSWLFAARLAQLQGIRHDAEVVAVSCLLHALGLVQTPAGPLRFEVEGANAARAFVRERGFDERRSQLVWDSVALNSTPSIGLHKEVEVALCTAGIGLDFGGWLYERIPPPEMAGILSAFPRLKMKRRIAGRFCRIVQANPRITYDNFTRDFGERYEPGYEAPSFVDMLMNAPFED